MILNRKTLIALLSAVALAAVVVLIALSHNRTLSAGAAPEVSEVSTDAYHAAARDVASAFAAAYSAGPDDATRRSAADTAVTALLALRVPPGNTAAHLELVSSLVSYRDALDAHDAEAAATAVARLRALGARESWIGIPSFPQ